MDTGSFDMNHEFLLFPSSACNLPKKYHVPRALKRKTGGELLWGLGVVSLSASLVCLSCLVGLGVKTENGDKRPQQREGNKGGNKPRIDW